MLCLHLYHMLHEWSLEQEVLGYLGNELNQCNSSCRLTNIERGKTSFCWSLLWCPQYLLNCLLSNFQSAEKHILFAIGTWNGKYHECYGSYTYACLYLSIRLENVSSKKEGLFVMAECWVSFNLSFCSNLSIFMIIIYCFSLNFIQFVYIFQEIRCLKLSVQYSTFIVTIQIGSIIFLLHERHKYLCFMQLKVEIVL